MSTQEALDELARLEPPEAAKTYAKVADAAIDELAKAVAEKERQLLMDAYTDGSLEERGEMSFDV